MREITTLGPYTAGEIPEPWEHTFADDAGAPIGLDGFGAGLVYSVDGATRVVRTATIVDDAVHVEWVDDDLARPGVLRGELVAENGELRFVRRVEMFIRRAVGGVFPDFPPSPDTYIDGGGFDGLYDDDIDGGTMPTTGPDQLDGGSL